MFTEPTVFILGAGASWHYGYPTGEELVKEVLDRAERLSKYFAYSRSSLNTVWPKCIGPAKSTTKEDIAMHWQAALTRCSSLRMGLRQVKPLVIDYYLGWNPSVRDLGRLLIGWVILERENQVLAAGGGNINRSPPFEKYKDDWCRFLTHKLAIGCKCSEDLLRNHVQFVTFNYDMSLEMALYKGLQHIELFKQNDVSKFLTTDRIFHIYGKVRSTFEAGTLNWNEDAVNPNWTHEIDPNWTGKANPRDSALDVEGYKEFLDDLYDVSEGIRVIDPEDKGADEIATQKAREAIERAKFVYILGYGFDENNSRRLGLHKSLFYAGMEKYVHFTNFENNNRVNKRASRIFFRRLNKIPPDGPSVFEDYPITQPFFYERSFRNVYDALERDFESLETTKDERAQ